MEPKKVLKIKAKALKKEIETLARSIKSLRKRPLYTLKSTPIDLRTSLLLIDSIKEEDKDTIPRATSSKSRKR